MESSSKKLDGFRAVTRPENSSQKTLALHQEIGLKLGRTHEIVGRSSDGFACAAIAKSKGPAIWIGRHIDIRSLSPLALSRYFNPSRLTLAECVCRKEILWAAEQALRSDGFEVVIFQLKQGPNLSESRRLQLASEKGGSLGLSIIERGAQSSAAQTRWQCDPAAMNDTEIIHPVWRWTLTKNKSGQLGEWLVRWKEDGHAAGNVDMVSGAVP